MPGGITIRRANIEEILDLRHRMLRAGLARETAHFAGDADPDTRHFAALVDNRVVGCVSLMRSTWQDAPAWQLRGMAVEGDLQGQGIGTSLLRAAEASATSTGPSILWCNARVPAVPFYHRHAWQPSGQPFDIPTAGPHQKMVKGG
jgi:GNAT superfamily N-acetyltransferase